MPLDSIKNSISIYDTIAHSDPIKIEASETRITQGLLNNTTLVNNPIDDQEEQNNITIEIDGNFFNDELSKKVPKQTPPIPIPSHQTSQAPLSQYIGSPTAELNSYKREQTRQNFLFYRQNECINNNSTASIVTCMAHCKKG